MVVERLYSGHRWGNNDFFLRVQISLPKLPISDLKLLLLEAEQREDFETCCKIRDKINALEK